MNWLVCPFLFFSLSLDLSILRWAFGKPSTVVSIWLVMKVMALSAFPIFMAWHSNRHSWMPLPDMAWFILYVTYLIVFAIFPVQEVCQHNLPPASSIIILAEQVINCIYFISASNSRAHNWFIFKYVLEYFLPLKWKLHSATISLHCRQSRRTTSSFLSSSWVIYLAVTLVMLHWAVVLNHWLCVIHPSFIVWNQRGHKRTYSSIWRG